ncbi:extracellular solute-binding protein [Streptomyces noursei]|uniref:extracellular solute-binding protein n=1 Tax=Streptomyces noursei TaxID=1971 RepID=UPI00082CFEB2|nr:extracellular solute-binding protein [Streptomyces noursei]
MTLKLLSHYGEGALKDELQRAVDDWNAGQSRSRVETVPVRFEDLLTTVVVRQAAGQGADILHLYALWTGQLVRAGVLRPIPAHDVRLVRSGFPNAATQAVSVEGTVFGYPTEGQTYGLYCNRRLLAAAGAAGPPRTWRELEAVARAATRRDHHGNTVVQGLALSRGDDSDSVNQVLALVAARGGAFLTPDGRRCALGSPSGEAVFSLQRRLVRSGVTDPAIDMYTAFSAGRAAMAVNGRWWCGSLLASMGERYHDVLTTALPGGRGTLATAYLMGVNTQCRHPEPAWEFVRWLNADSTRIAGALVTRMSALQWVAGSMTARIADIQALFGEHGDPNARPFLDALAYATPEPNGPKAQQAKALLRKNIEEMWSGRLSAAEAIGITCRQVDRELCHPG